MVFYSLGPIFVDCPKFIDYVLTSTVNHLIIDNLQTKNLRISQISCAHSVLGSDLYFTITCLFKQNLRTLMMAWMMRRRTRSIITWRKLTTLLTVMRSYEMTAPSRFPVSLLYSFIHCEKITSWQQMSFYIANL